MEEQQEFQLSSTLLLFLLVTYCGTKLVYAGDGSLSSETSFLVYQQFGYPRDCHEILRGCSSVQMVSGVYLIKPDGYPEPFEAYCENDLNTSGWTVLQRRHMGLLNFSRPWKDFKTGFGFLGSEFFIGNEKLAFLTNQKQYQLQIDFTNTSGEKHYVTYDRFRITDEWREYSLSSVGKFDGCTIFSSETCEYSCDDPETCISPPSGVEGRCACIGDNKMHQGNCIPQEQCGCYDSEKGAVIRNGDSYINTDCTMRSNCSNNQLNVEPNYRCNADATCEERDGVLRCYCKADFQGDGVTCRPIASIVTPTYEARDCHELYLAGADRDGVYTIYPYAYPGGIVVYCEMESNGGGWTIFQRRSSASVDFDRVWSEYKIGFGNASQDHWLGNEYIHHITHQKRYQLRIDMRDSTSSSYYAVYSSFSINDEDNKYRLSIGPYSGNADYNALGGNNNKEFSTRDQDNDGNSNYNCAERHTGGWWFWYSDGCNGHSCSSNQFNCEFFQNGSCCTRCSHVNLNGDYDSSARGTNIFWGSFRVYECEFRYSEMKIRPIEG